MPTNLPPEYFKIDEEFRAAKSNPEKIELLEEMLSVIPKHKGTDKLRADLRRKLSKLKTSSQGQKRLGRKESAFNIDKEGAGQVALVGLSNVGKSTFLASLTNATPELSQAPYTTWTPTPGMMLVEDIQVQLIDTPSLNPDYVDPALLDLIRRADLLLLIVDLLADPFEQLESALELLSQHRIYPERKREQIEESRRNIFLPLIVLVNKNDDESTDEDYAIFCELMEEDYQTVSISALTGRNVENLKRLLFNRLEVIRVYSKAPGQEPDMDVPFVLKRGSTIDDLAGEVHQDFYKKLKSARVWGSSAFEGQMVSREYVLSDGDVVELKI